MNTNTLEGNSEKRVTEAVVQNIPHNITTIQSVQNIVQGSSSSSSSNNNVQTTQNVNTTLALSSKSVSLDLNPKLSLMKLVVQTSGASSANETNKIPTHCSTVPIERQQITPQYHVPRGPAAVANISAPRSTVAIPIVRAGQSVIPIVKTGMTTTVQNTQWPPKTSVVYAQPQLQCHPVPPVNRMTRPPTAVYSGPQPRLVAPARPVQTTIVTNPPGGTPSRLITPVLQTNNTVTRIPVLQSRLPTPQISNATTSIQTVRHQPQTIQTNQQLTRASTVTTNRVTVSTPVVGTTNRITTATPVKVQPGFNRVVIPTQTIQQPQGHQQGARVLQTITTLGNIGSVSRVIATTSNPSNVTRVTQPTSTAFTRITGMTLHSLPIQTTIPIATTRPIPTPVKPVVSGSTTTHAVQIKSAPPTSLRVTPAAIVSTTAVTTTSTTTTTIATIPTSTAVSTATIIINNTNTISTNSTSVPQPSIYTQYRQAAVQPVRLVVEPTHEEALTKANASPRPSILRKRDHDNSPAKCVAKNLVPVLAALPSNTALMSSPPQSPRNDRGDGNQSSGSTTVSATSSPGLDDEPEQSRIPMNHMIEMSPRKKPRKQQLTEFTESRCNEEEIQFISDDKTKKDDGKDKLSDEQRTNSNSQAEGNNITATVVIRNRPTPSLLGSSWKNRWGGRLHHYRRPSDVRPREERRPSVAEIAQQKYVLQKLHGWKVYQLTAQMEDLAELEKQVHEKLKTTLTLLESQQPKNRVDDGLERANELIKGNMQRSTLISEGMGEARTQLVAIFQHKNHVSDILQRCGSKRSQKKREK